MDDGPCDAVYAEVPGQTHIKESRNLKDFGTLVSLSEK